MAHQTSLVSVASHCAVALTLCGGGAGGGAGNQRSVAHADGVDRHDLVVVGPAGRETGVAVGRAPAGRGGHELPEREAAVGGHLDPVARDIRAAILGGAPGEVDLRLPVRDRVQGVRPARHGGEAHEFDRDAVTPPTRPWPGPCRTIVGTLNR